MLCIIRGLLLQMALLYLPTLRRYTNAILLLWSSVCVSQSVSQSIVTFISPAKTGWTDWDAVCGADSSGTKDHMLDGVHIPRGAEAILVGCPAHSKAPGVLLQCTQKSRTDRDAVWEGGGRLAWTQDPLRERAIFVGCPAHSKALAACAAMFEQIW